MKLEDKIMEQLELVSAMDVSGERNAIMQALEWVLNNGVMAPYDYLVLG